MSFLEEDEDFEGEQFCRICGLDYGSPVRDDTGYESHDICPCCDAEVGIEDETLESVREYREQWLKEGGKWRSDSSFVAEPEGWNREEQMKNIPPEWL